VSSGIPAPTLTPLADLRPHPRNYRQHPPEQIEHLAASIREHGCYRNVVATSDGTILAGHGVVLAATEAGLDAVPVVTLSLEPESPLALKILAGDNEIARLATLDEVGLVEILADLEAEGALLGTGFDGDALATLRRLAEGRGLTDVLAEWEGMPEFEQDDRQSAYHTTVHFATEADAERFFELVAVERRSSFWWPESDGHVGSDVGHAWVEAEAS